MPFTVTEKAAAALKYILDKADHEPEQLLRLISGPGGLGLALDTEREGDHVVEHEGEKIMVIAPDLAERLSSVTLDNTQTTEDPSFESA